MPKSRHRKKTGKRRSSGRLSQEAVLIRQVARFPLRECRINENWAESLMASITFARNRPDSRVAIASFAVDLGCLGVKSAFANPNISVAMYEQRLVYGQSTRQVLFDPSCAVKLIQGAYGYAKQLGFEPDPDYYYAREIFGEIEAERCNDAFEYGKDGKPLYVAGPYDDVDKIIDHLRRKLGPDGFHYVIPFGPLG